MFIEAKSEKKFIQFTLEYLPVFEKKIAQL
jgi:hypothetical protein